MPATDIVFSPSVDERQLDRETDQVNERLNEVGEDVPVTFDEESMDGLTPAGAGGGGGRGRGGGGGGGNVPVPITSRIPKPIAGVTAAAAVPVGLAGAVGVGMLSAMHGASARLQTSTSLLGQAWNNVWRPLGDKLDQLFIRDIALDLFEETRDFGDAIRSGDWLEAASIGAGIELDAALSWSKYVPGLRWTRFLDGVDWSDFLPRVNWSGFIPNFRWPSLPDFSWPSIDPPDWGSLTPELPKWDNLRPELPDWSGLELNLPDWLEQSIGGGGGDNGGGDDWQTIGDNDDGLWAGGESGGGSGTNRDNTAQWTQASRSVDVDTSGIERRLDRLHDDMRRMRDELNRELVVDGESIGEVARDNLHNSINDSDPLA